MHIPLVYEHLFYKYFVSRSGYKRQKSFATYGCCHPCFYVNLFKAAKQAENSGCEDAVILGAFLHDIGKPIRENKEAEC